MSSAYMGDQSLSIQGPFSFESKVIYFEKLDNSFIGLYENSNQTNFDTKDAVLLAQFPILEMDQESITFDFDHGMKHIYQKRNTHSYNNSLNREHTLNIVESFLYQASIVSNHLIIKHHVKVEQIGPSGNIFHESINMKYTFSSYVNNNQFVEKNHPDKSLFAFYETQLKPEGRKVIKTSNTHPITFYYTENVPKEFENAIINGVLYWNKLLGKDLLHIKKLSQPSEAFDPGMHIIEWSDEERNYAYTSIQNDPFTGEILQTYINFPNPLNSPQYKLISKYLEQRTSHFLNKISTESPINIHQFNTSIITQSELDTNVQREQHSFNHLLTGVEDDFMTKEICQRVFADLITALIAHEVGHALGIKHNFAGSLGTNISIYSKKDLYYNYVLYDKLDSSFITTFSVMDYLPFTFLALTGAKIRKNQMDFSWDALSIKWLYFDQEMVNLFPQPLFCSDQDNESRRWIDCKSFDSFQNPIEGRISNFEDNLEFLSYDLAQHILDLKEETLSLLPPDKFSNLLNSKKIGEELFKNYQLILDTLKDNVTFMQTSNTTTFQEISLDGVNKTLEEILLTPFTINPTPDGPPLIPLISHLKKLVIQKLHTLSQKQEIDLSFIPKLDQLFYHIEEVVLNNYLTYLDQSMFTPLFKNHFEKIEFLKSLKGLITTHFNALSKNPIDIQNKYFYPKFFPTDFSRDDIRNRLISILLNPNLFQDDDLTLLKKDMLIQIHNHMVDEINTLENRPISPINPNLYLQFINNSYEILDRIKNEI